MLWYFCTQILCVAVFKTTLNCSFPNRNCSLYYRSNITTKDRIMCNSRKPSGRWKQYRYRIITTCVTFSASFSTCDCSSVSMYLSSFDFHKVLHGIHISYFAVCTYSKLMEGGLTFSLQWTWYSHVQMPIRSDTNTFGIRWFH